MAKEKTKMKVPSKLDIDHHYHHQFYGYLALHKSNGFPRNIAKPSSLLWENAESTLLQNEIPICPQKAQNHPILKETYYVNHAIFWNRARWMSTFFSKVQKLLIWMTVWFYQPHNSHWCDAMHQWDWCCCCCTIDRHDWFFLCVMPMLR